MAAIAKMRIDWLNATPYLSQIDANALFYCFTLPGKSDSAAVHARGIFPEGEDPATGSAAGCAISWLVQHRLIEPQKRIVIEQGTEIKRPSYIFVKADKRNDHVENVRVGGYAVQIATGEYTI